VAGLGWYPFSRLKPATRPENPFPHFPRGTCNKILNNCHIKRNPSGVYLYLKMLPKTTERQQAVSKNGSKESFAMRMNCTEEREIVPFIYSSLTPCC